MSSFNGGFTFASASRCVGKMVFVSGALASNLGLDNQRFEIVGRFGVKNDYALVGRSVSDSACYLIFRASDFASDLPLVWFPKGVKGVPFK